MRPWRELIAPHPDVASGRYRPNDGHEAPTTRSSPAPLLGASLGVEAVPVEVSVVETGVEETDNPLEQASNPVDLLPLRQRPNKVPIAGRNRVHGGRGLAIVSGSSVNGKG